MDTREAGQYFGKTGRVFSTNQKQDDPSYFSYLSRLRPTLRGLPGQGSLGNIYEYTSVNNGCFSCPSRRGGGRPPRCLKFSFLMLTFVLLYLVGGTGGGVKEGGPVSVLPSLGQQVGAGTAASLAGGPALVAFALDDAAIARYYGASWLAEPPTDAVHCLGEHSFPRETPSYGVSVATSRKYVMPNCEGGIGNQVFCAAAALAYAMEFGRCLVISKIFLHPSSVNSVSYRDTVFRHLWVEPALRPTPQGKECALPDGKACPVKDALAEVVQPGLSMHWEPFTAPRYAEYWVAVLMGGWQHFWYTWRWRAVLAAYLRPSPATVRALLAKYPDLVNGVALHFRRGDFIKSLPAYKYVNRDFPTASDFYYAQALHLLLANITAAAAADGAAPPLTFFIFTNDYAWARTSAFVASLPGKVVFPEHEDEVYTWYLMMLTRKGIVCPNSTYCWWAAYIGHLGRYITLPNHWYNSPGSEPTGIHFPGATVVHSDNARGEGPKPWYPRPWEISDPEAGVAEIPWEASEAITYPLPPSYYTKRPTHTFKDEAALF